MKLSTGDKITILAIGVAGLGMVETAFPGSDLPRMLREQILGLIAWEYAPFILAAVAVFWLMAIIVRK